MSKPNVFQLNNDFIQQELRKSKQYQEENRRKNRFMGWILILVMLLFILPTYNLVQSYQKLQEKEAQLVELEQQYKELVDIEKVESTLVKKLQDDDYAAKYIRAKYQYSKYGEFIYNIPGLLPK